MAKIKIYTRGGDTGESSLLDGSRVSKDDARLEAYGTMDELNSFLGLLHALLQTLSRRLPRKVRPLMQDVERIQDQIFRWSSHLATAEPKIRERLPAYDVEFAVWLESRIDALTEALPELKNFVLPGQDQLSAITHLCRTVCRRAERDLTRLHRVDGTLDPRILVGLNRLSDYLFTAARYCQIRLSSRKERVWRSKSGG